MKKAIFITTILFLSAATMFAQERTDSVRVYADSIVNITADKTISNATFDTLKVEEVKDSLFKPDPVKAMWWGAILPGFGQIVNKKYWKLPFVYGGFLGFAYAISWNNGRYESYKNAYRDIIDTDPKTNSYIDILPRGVTIDMLGGMGQYTALLKSNQDNFRRYRDLSILLSIAYYGLVLLDAYVDAHLYDFDISPDLSLNISPALIPQSHTKRNAYGLQLSFNF